MDESGWNQKKVYESGWSLGDCLVTICWPFGDHLVTTCWPFDDYFWLFSDQSVTTYWSFGDYLVTIWWPFGDHLVTTLSVILQFFLSSSLCDHLVTPQHICTISFFAPVSTAHPPAFGAYWYFRQFCHDIYFFEGFERYVHNKKQISRDIYDITIWWYHHNYYHNYPCIHHYNHRNFLRSSAQNFFFDVQKRGPSCIGGMGV